MVLWYLIFERGIKGVGLLVVAFYLFTHIGSGLDSLINRIIGQLDLDPGSNFLKEAIYDLVLRFVGISQTSLVALAVGSFLYGVIESAESIGLILRRRWAEYLVILATAFFIPVEVVELARKPTLLKAAAFVINVVVVVYLVRRKRLFSFDESAAQR